MEACLPASKPAVYRDTMDSHVLDLEPWTWMAPICNLWAASPDIPNTFHDWIDTLNALQDLGVAPYAGMHHHTRRATGTGSTGASLSIMQVLVHGIYQTCCRLAMPVSRSPSTRRSS